MTALQQQQQRLRLALAAIDKKPLMYFTFGQLRELLDISAALGNLEGLAVRSATVEQLADRVDELRSGIEWEEKMAEL